MRNQKGMTGIEIAVALAVLGALGWFAAPKVFHGASRRAENSAQATQALEQATQAQGASAAASVAKIGEAAAMAPDSPAIDFIRQETPVALAKLPAPDAQALLDAERRRAAVMEGKFELAKSLYVQAFERAEKLQVERDRALEARRRADVALQEAAAAERASLIQAMVLTVVAIVVLGLWAWARVNGLKFQGVVKRVVPILDQAYDNAAEDMREFLDEKVFTPLSKKMDEPHKKLVKQTRVES